MSLITQFWIPKGFTLYWNTSTLKCTLFYKQRHDENEAENENRSHRYDINGPRPTHGHKYIRYKIVSV